MVRQSYYCKFFHQIAEYYSYYNICTEYTFEKALHPYEFTNALYNKL